MASATRGNCLPYLRASAPGLIASLLHRLEARVLCVHTWLDALSKLWFFRRGKGTMLVSRLKIETVSSISLLLSGNFFSGRNFLPTNPKMWWNRRFSGTRSLRCSVLHPLRKLHIQHVYHSWRSLWDHLSRSSCSISQKNISQRRHVTKNKKIFTSRSSKRSL